jgi:hypothetical protein
MARLAEHPFLVGLGVTLLLALGYRLLPTAWLGPTEARGVGLIVYGAALVVLFRLGLDRDDVVWFFLGGACGLILALPLLLRF